MNPSILPFEDKKEKKKTFWMDGCEGGQNTDLSECPDFVQASLPVPGPEHTEELPVEVSGMRDHDPIQEH